MNLRCIFYIGCFCAGFVLPSIPSMDTSWVLVRSAQAADQISDQEVQGAKAFIERVADNGISFLEDERLTHEERTAQFKELLNDSFDMKTIARFAMGRYWRNATQEQKSRYYDLFKKMTVEVYSRRFSEYQGQRLDVDSVRAEGTRDALVTSYITSPDHPKVQVDWRVRLKNDQYRIIDVIVEGVSMALTQRSDFSSVIQRGGGKIDVLLAHLDDTV